MKSAKIKTADAIEQEIDFEISCGIADGISINAGTSDETFIEKAWGRADAGSDVKMRTDTIIDMASVTKGVATSTALAICHDEKLIDFDAPFTNYLPDYKAELERPVSIRDLAMHISGFGQQEHYTSDEGGEIRRRLLSTPPQNSSEKRFEYSCWNFHLLGMIIERVSGKSLPDFCRERIFKPLEMHDSSLGAPVSADVARLAKTCATDKPGRISDFIAFRLYRDGFTAGNAGLFSCAGDLAKFCKCLLRGGKLPSGARLLSDCAFDAISVPRISSGPVKRSFGWIASDEFKPPSSSARTIYHSGWSGQTVFIDLDRQFYAVVLTTRALDEYERSRRGRFKIIEELYGFLDGSSATKKA